jgi:ribosomal protein S3
VKIWIYLGEVFPKDFKRQMSENAIDESAKDRR